MSDPPDDLNRGRADVGDVELHYVEAGDGDGERPLVLLLHGFPQFWYCWRHQLDPLAEAGYHVVAPDLRGYNRSDKPTGIDSYRIGHLLDDVEGLVGHFDRESATVVGHDWGGIVGWELAIRRSAILDGLVAVNAPHPAAYARELATPEQLLRSSYAAFFQLPRVPEWVLRRRNYAPLRLTFCEDPVRPGTFTEEDIRRYVRAIARPGALTAALNYYRAIGPRFLVRLVCERAPGLEPRSPPTSTPIGTSTLVIWGERDRALAVSLTRGLERWIRDVRIERLADASHWVQEDAPDEVTGFLLDFLDRTA